MALRVRPVIEDSTVLVAKTFGYSRGVLVASPELLAKHGPVDTPADLAKLPTAAMSVNGEGRAEWRLEGPNGRSLPGGTHHPRYVADDLLTLQDRRSCRAWAPACCPTTCAGATLEAAELVRGDHGHLAARRHRPRFPAGLHRRARSRSTRGRAIPGWCCSRIPADFTPVCTTELGKTAALSGEFAKRGVKPIAVSVDPVDRTASGSATSRRRRAPRSTSRSWPTPTARSPLLYDMIHPNALANATVRSVFIIDPKKVIRTTLTYPAEHRPQLRRDPARDRFAAADRQPQGGDARRLERRRRRGHPPQPAGPGRTGPALPQGLQGRQALPARHAPAEQVSDEAGVIRACGKSHSGRGAGGAGRLGLAQARPWVPLVLESDGPVVIARTAWAALPRRTCRPPQRPHSRRAAGGAGRSRASGGAVRLRARAVCGAAVPQHRGGQQQRPLLPDPARRAYSRAWGSEFVRMQNAGHINIDRGTETGRSAWPCCS
jgi:peroxiredoxin